MEALKLDEILHNDQYVLEYFSTDESIDPNGFLTMVKRNNYSEVEIQDENIAENSSFILNMWD